MSTSAIDRKGVKLAFYHLLFAAVTALGGFVYEQFSHGVYSDFMMYAFLPPLVLGACPLLIRALRGKALPGRWCVLCRKPCGGREKMMIHPFDKSAPMR